MSDKKTLIVILVVVVMGLVLTWYVVQTPSELTISTDSEYIDKVTSIDNINIDRDFKYVSKGWPMGLSVTQTSAIGLSPEPYEILVKEPKYISDQVLYGYLILGNSEDNKISFVVDDLESEQHVLYVDKNNNEDLADDGSPYSNQGTGKLATIIFLNIDVISLAGEKIVRPYKLWFFINESSGKKRPRFYTRCHYKGQIMIGDLTSKSNGTYQIMQRLIKLIRIFRHQGI